MKQPAFKINERVYHCTPESPVGVVTNVAYYYATGHFEYQVTFSAEVASLWYPEHELSKNKTFS